MDVVIGTPIYRHGSYVVGNFMANQKQIQQCYESSELILATSEHDFFKELQCLLSDWKLRGKAMLYDVIKPDYARDRIWNIVCGREAIREYTLSQTQGRYLLFLDADMTFEPPIIIRMEEEIRGYDAVFSGSPLRGHGTGLAGAGCVMLTRSILEKVRFRCCEFKNGEVISEDNLLEMDLFHLGGRVKKGFFLSVRHYRSATEVVELTPHAVGTVRKIANSSLIRYVLLRMSLITHRNIPWKLKQLLCKCRLRY